MPGDGGFIAFISDTPHAPLPTADIVLPAGWGWVVDGDEIVAAPTLGSVSTVGDIAVPSQDLTTRAA
jgi:hypothetical protein